MHLRDLLSTHGLSAYIDVFERENVAPEDLPGLTDDELRGTFGMLSFGERERFRALVAEWTTQRTAPAADDAACPVATPEHAAHTPRLMYRGARSAFLGLGGNEVAFTMAVVPPCRFTMGSPPSEADRFSDEPEHEVRLTRSFAIRAEPVTQALYEAVTGRNPSAFQSGVDAPQRPVENVSWYDAVRFCNALSVRVGLRPAYDIAGGDSMDDVGWHDGNSQRTSHPVGRKRSNRWGLHDMSGNVFEWCEDVYAGYTRPLAVDPRGPVAGAGRVSRGGSWCTNASDARVAYRVGIDPDYFSANAGFRLSRTIL
jgi:hypothetical protein